MTPKARMRKGQFVDPPLRTISAEERKQLKIASSDLFKLLNTIIDAKALDLVKLCKTIKLVAEPPKETTRVNIRVSCETGDRKEPRDVDVDLFIPDLERTREAIDRAIALEREINGLQRVKLRLLNDYDFTKGDDSFQKSFFPTA